LTEEPTATTPTVTAAPIHATRTAPGPALTAVQIAGAVQNGAASAVDVIDDALVRLHGQDHVRAFRAVWDDQALAVARRVDAAIAEGVHLPLGGVPLALKAGEEDRSEPARRLIAAGCIPVGITSIPGPGTSWQTWGSTDRGPTLNPIDPTRSPGGSSAGSAAAVAAGLVPLATGSDGAGSVRIPAAWCGVLGLKLTTGRMPARDRAGLTAAGVLASDVDDVAAYLDALLPRTRPASSQPLRAAWSTLGVDDVDDDVLISAHRRALQLHDLGVLDLSEVDVRLHDPGPTWLALRRQEPQETSARRDVNDQVLADLFSAYDLVLTPTTPNAPHGHDGPGARMSVALTWAFNLSGHPALSLPAGQDAAGLPVGLQAVGRHGYERELLRLGTNLCC